MKLLEYDKIGHLSAYATFCFTLLAWTRRQFQRANNGCRYLIFVVVTGSVLGIVLELLQGFVLTGRYFDYLDVIANIIGAIIGAVFASLIIKKTPV